MNFQAIFDHAPMRMFGLTATILAYVFALYVRRQRWGQWIHPLLLTCLLLIAMLLALPYLRVPWTLTDYNFGGDVLRFFLGPATVALAVPLYKHRHTLRRHATQISTTIFAGCLVGIFSAGLVAIAFHASREVLLSVLSKSVTTPITMEITRALGGNPDLAATITVITGLFGAVVGPTLLHLLGQRFRKHSAIGLAIGVSSHGIGTSSVLRHSELQGTYAGLALALNGILTAAILTPLAPWIQKIL